MVLVGDINSTHILLYLRKLRQYPQLELIHLRILLNPRNKPHRMLRLLRRNTDIGIGQKIGIIHVNLGKIGHIVSVTCLEKPDYG